VSPLLNDEDARWRGDLTEDERRMEALEARDRADEHEGNPHFHRAPTSAQSRGTDPSKPEEG
jgi:hypothetical protein